MGETDNGGRSGQTLGSGRVRPSSLGPDGGLGWGVEMEQRVNDIHGLPAEALLKACEEWVRCGGGAQSGGLQPLVPG